MSDIKIITFSGLTTYDGIEEKMRLRASEIAASDELGELWVVEHNHVYTKGVSADDKDVIDTGNTPVFESSRGGKHTYHGPGQRVVYTLVNLKKLHATPDVRKFVNQLEDSIIGSLKEFRVESFKSQERIGIWVNDNNIEKKIASLGIKLHKWVAYHGIAVNVSTDLSYFDGIVPCGLYGYTQCSLKSLGHDIRMDKFDDILISNIKKHLKSEK